MSFIESLSRWGSRLLALTLAACSSSVPQPEPHVSPTPVPTPGGTSAAQRGESPSVLVSPKLAPAVASRNWDEFRRQAGQRLVAANPQRSYTGAVPDVLLAIPVITVELNADGSIRRMDVMRHPKQAQAPPNWPWTPYAVPRPLVTSPACLNLGSSAKPSSSTTTVSSSPVVWIDLGPKLGSRSFSCSRISNRSVDCSKAHCDSTTNRFVAIAPPVAG